ncbi:MAG: LuxR C-terminal-related transcriptional regulator [Nocardioides sp.]
MTNDDWFASQGREHGLTLRESQVLAFITEGLTNLEIAEATYLSINSVKTYIRTAYRKIGVNRRAQAVAWGMTHGYAPSDRPTDRPTDQPSDRPTDQPGETLIV